MRYYFYNNRDLTIRQILSQVNRDYPIPIINSKIGGNYISLSLHEHKSKIRIITSDDDNILSIDSVPLSFEVIGYMTILSILFNELGILFYDDNYIYEVEYFDEVNDNKYYDAVLRGYIVECMAHHGIIKSEDDINNKLYNNKGVFCNPYLLDKAKYVQIKRISSKLKRKQFTLIIEKIKMFFKNLFY